MSETHSNAFLLEAGEKRRQAANLLAEADALESKVAVEPAEKPKRVRKPAAKPEPKPEPKKGLVKRVLGK